MRVLVVDDNSEIQRIYATMLRGLGYDVDTSSDGQEAIERFKSTAYDAILSDVSMPGVGGVEFLRMVKEHKVDVPVVLMTGGPTLDSAIKAVEYGAFRYLSKPIDIKELSDVMGRATRLHALAKLKQQALEMMGGEERWLGDRAAIEKRFEHALETIWIAFQPIVSFRERRVFGYEALLRTDEPTLASPLDFLDLAEQLGRLSEVSRLVRSRVAEAAEHLPEDVRLFVNLNICDLQDKDLYSPGSPLAARASRVVLEFTERASLETVKDVRSRVAALRRLGFHIAIDDLGAGYAGLSSLSLLEPQVVKLDMSIVRGVQAQATNQRVIESMTKLCHELGVHFIAEGVETVEERATLSELGCELFQGFLFARPQRQFVEPRWSGN